MKFTKSQLKQVILEVLNEQWTGADTSAKNYQDKAETTYGNGGYGAIINDAHQAVYVKSCKKHIKKNLKEIANELLDLANNIK